MIRNKDILAIGKSGFERAEYSAISSTMQQMIRRQSQMETVKTRNDMLRELEILSTLYFFQHSLKTL